MFSALVLFRGEEVGRVLPVALPPVRARHAIGRNSPTVGDGRGRADDRLARDRDHRQCARSPPPARRRSTSAPLGNEDLGANHQYPAVLGDVLAQRSTRSKLADRGRGEPIRRGRAGVRRPRPDRATSPSLRVYRSTSEGPRETPGPKPSPLARVTLATYAPTGAMRSTARLGRCSSLGGSGPYPSPSGWPRMGQATRAQTPSRTDARSSCLRGIASAVRQSPRWNGTMSDSKPSRSLQRRFGSDPGAKNASRSSAPNFSTGCES